MFDCFVYAFSIVLLNYYPQVLYLHAHFSSPFLSIKYRDYFLYIEFIGNKVYFTSIIRFLVWFTPLQMVHIWRSSSLARKDAADALKNYSLLVKS